VRLLLVSLTVIPIVYGLSRFQEPDTANSKDPAASAQAFVRLLSERDFSAAEKYFDDTMKKALPQSKLQETWDTIIAQAGTLKRQINTRTDKRGKYTVGIVTCEFEKASIDIEVVLDQTNLVAGLFFKPATAAVEYKSPAYVKANALREENVTIGTGEWALPGTLTFPVGQHSSPAVVLVHGSGPHDRDETIGPNKPFRDLSMGLASNGIAVLRYEKRTKQHGQKFASVKRLTVKEEVIDDVFSAVAMLRKTPGIDAKKIFVLGHSLGGTLVPRIGQADPTIAGFIVLAGAVKSLEDAILEQTTYIFSLDGVISTDEQVQLDGLKQLAAKVKGLKPSDIDSATDLFGAPASYWLDLRDYNPPEVAKSLKQPLLIIQGERDYQVTMDDFRRWQVTLSSRENVTLRSYPKLNHLFIEGNGKSTPAEYSESGHVAEIVISDIANWIKMLSPHR
jgi:uncharacterized protein